MAPRIVSFSNPYCGERARSSAARRKYFNFFRRRSRGITKVNVARKNPGNHFARAATQGKDSLRARSPGLPCFAFLDQCNIRARRAVLDKVVSNTLPPSLSFYLNASRPSFTISHIFPRCILPRARPSVLFLHTRLSLRSLSAAHSPLSYLERRWKRTGGRNIASFNERTRSFANSCFSVGDISKTTDEARETDRRGVVVSARAVALIRPA